MKESIKIFISYAPEDRRLLERLEKHLALLRRQELVILCHNRDISAGTEWAREIENYLNTAEIILLLVSADFLSSEYCYSVEMKRAMARHDAGNVRVIPIILRPCDWKTAPFGKLQALPANVESLLSPRWRHLDEAFSNITSDIRRIVEEIKVGKSQAHTTYSFVSPLRAAIPNRLPRSRNFVGRDAEITKLIACLRANESCGIYAINGMGGIGKTALAAEIVGRFLQDREVFPGGAAWISCEGLEGPSGLVEIWKRVALALRLEQVVKMTDTDAQRTSLIDGLIQLPRLLLALDNVEPKLDAEALLDTLAVHGCATLLVTARQALVPERLTFITLSPLSMVNGEQLLLQRLKQVDDHRPAESDYLLVQQVVSALGGLPLAIELVAAYAGIQHLSLVHVLQELEQDRLQAASLNFDPKRALKSRFNRSWFALSIQEQQLFAGLSLIRGNIFPRKSADILASILYQKQQNALARQTVAKLVTYALIEPVGFSYIRLHPLLREYALEQFRGLESEQLKTKLQNEAEFVNNKSEMYPPNYEGLKGNEANAVWEQYQKERQALFDQARRDLADFKTFRRGTIHSHFGSLESYELLKFGIYLGEQGDWSLARKYLLESLDAADKALGQEWVFCHVYLALLDEQEDNYSDAINHYHTALRLLSSTFKGFSPEGRIRLFAHDGIFIKETIKRIGNRLNLLQEKINQNSRLTYLDGLRGFIGIAKENSLNGVTDIYELWNEPLHIGRNQDSDIYLEETIVSRNHATIFPLDDKQCGLKDEGSANGTWINNQRINKHQLYLLRPTDTILIGKTNLFFTKFDFLCLRCSMIEG